MTPTIRTSIVTLGLIVSACASSRLELPSDHPANPRARTAPLELASLLAEAPASSPRREPAPAHAHDHATPTGDTYTCPMHPEVERSGPGQCPICGMNLVKKSAPAPKQEPAR